MWFQALAFGLCVSFVVLDESLGLSEPRFYDVEMSLVFTMSRLSLCGKKASLLPGFNSSPFGLGNSTVVEHLPSMREGLGFIPNAESMRVPKSVTYRVSTESETLCWKVWCRRECVCV